MWNLNALFNSLVIKKKSLRLGTGKEITTNLEEKMISPFYSLSFTQYITKIFKDLSNLIYEVPYYHFIF